MLIWSCYTNPAIKVEKICCIHSFAPSSRTRQTPLGRGIHSSGGFTSKTLQLSSDEKTTRRVMKILSKFVENRARKRSGKIHGARFYVQVNRYLKYVVDCGGLRTWRHGNFIWHLLQRDQILWRPMKPFWDTKGDFRSRLLYVKWIWCVLVRHTMIKNVQNRD